MAIFSNNSSRAPGTAELPVRRGESLTLSIVATGMRITGDLETDGVVKIEGHVKGSIRAGQQVLIAQGGIVEGDLFTREAIVGGEVHGLIRAEERVEIQTTAVVQGDIMTRRIAILEGGRVNGEVNMAVTAEAGGESESNGPSLRLASGQV